MHAFSYEHMELAAYELLKRLAERAGDEETARMAAAIAAEEARMAERLEQNFDAAVEASLADADADQLDSTLLAYLRDVHALEGQADRAAGGRRRAGRRRAARGGVPRAPRGDPPPPGADRGPARGAGRGPSMLKDATLKSRRAQPLRLFRCPARLDHQARRLRFRLRAPRDRRLRTAATGRGLGRRRGRGRGRRGDPRRGAPGSRARGRDLESPRGPPRRGLVNQRAEEGDAASEHYEHRFGSSRAAFARCRGGASAGRRATPAGCRGRVGSRAGHGPHGGTACRPRSSPNRSS